MAGLFAGLHVLLADRTGTPELALSPDEATLILARASAVLSHYSVETTQKTLDWISFVGALGTVYVPRVVAISLRQRHADAVRPTPQAPAPPSPDPHTANGAAGGSRPARRGRGQVEAPPAIDIDFANGAPDQEEL
jgi:hypothetical protein